MLRRFLGGGEGGGSKGDEVKDAVKGAPEAAAKEEKKASEPPQPREPSVNLTKQLNSRFQLGPARKNPVVALVLGMAGSGKTTLMQRIAVQIYEKQTPSYIINLDPAAEEFSYPVAAGAPCSEGPVHTGSIAIPVCCTPQPECAVSRGNRLSGRRHHLRAQTSATSSHSKTSCRR